MDQSNEILLGKLALQQGYLTQAHLDILLREQASGGGRTLAELLVERHFLTPEELLALQRLQATNLARPSDYSSKPRLETMIGGEALRRGWITLDQLNDAIRVQGLLEAQGDAKRLGEILYARGYLTRSQVFELLRSQGKQLASCPGCGSQYNLAGVDLSRPLLCPKCRSLLREGAQGERLDASGSFIGRAPLILPASDAGAASPEPPAPPAPRGAEPDAPLDLPVLQPLLPSPPQLRPTPPVAPAIDAGTARRTRPTVQIQMPPTVPEPTAPRPTPRTSTRRTEVGLHRPSNETRRLPRADAPPEAPPAPPVRKTSRPTARLTRPTEAAEPQYVDYRSRRRAGRPGVPWTTVAALAGAAALLVAALVISSSGSSARLEQAAADARAAAARTEALDAAFASVEAASRARPLDLSRFLDGCRGFAARAGDSPLGDRALALAARLRRDADEAKKKFDEAATSVGEHKYGEAMTRLLAFPARLDVEGKLASRIPDLLRQVRSDAELALAALSRQARQLAAEGKLDEGIALLQTARRWGLPDLQKTVDAALDELNAWQSARTADAAELAARKQAQGEAAAARKVARRDHVEAARKSLLEAHAKKSQELRSQADRIIEATRKSPLTLDLSKDLVLKDTRILQYSEDGVTVESQNPKVRMPLAWDILDPKVAYDLRRSAYPPDEAESHYQLGRFCTLRDLLDDAQREFDLAAKLDPAYAGRLPDLKKFRERKNLFKGDWRRVGTNFLRVAYPFNRPEEIQDFRSREGTTVDAKNGRLHLGGQKWFWASPKEVAFLDEVTVNASGFKGQGASPLFGVFFTKDGELETGFVVRVDPEGRGFSVEKWTQREGEELLPSTPLPAGPITLRFASLKFEVLAGGKTVWKGDEHRFSEVMILVGGMREEAGQGSVSIDQLSMEGKVGQDWIRKTFSEAETLALRELEEDLRPGGRVRRRKDADADADAPLSIEEDGLKGLSPRAREAYQRVKAGISRGEIEDPEELFLGLGRLLAEAPGFAGGYFFRGLLGYRYMGETAAGLSDMTKALELAPDFHEARILLARLYLHRGDLDAAREQIRMALETAPDYPEAYAARGSLAFRRHAYDDAIADLELAVELEPSDLETRQSLRNARHVKRGPLWTKTHAKESPHYLVRSDISAAKAAQFAESLEAVAAYYAETFHVSLPTSPKGDVLVFETKEGYQTYAELSTDNRAEFTLGYYHPEYRQLMLFEDKGDASGADTMHVLYHEGFHQFFEPLLPEAPFWLNEGLAEYFGASEVKGGKVVKTARVLEGRLRGLQYYLRAGQPILPFKRILLETPAEFYGGPPQLVSFRYAQAWAMIHFFMSGREPVLKETLQDYIKDLREGMTNRSAFKKTWAKVDLAAAEKAFVRYALDLK